MDSPLLIAAGASFVAGLIGYVVARLWIKPIVRYNITKRKVIHELTRYLGPIKGNAGPEETLEKQKRSDAILRAARKQAMNLVSGYETDIPYWYRLLLDSRQESPAEALRLLTNLDRIRNREQVADRIDRACKTLGLK